MVPGTRQAEPPWDGEGAGWWKPHLMTRGLLDKVQCWGVGATAMGSPGRWWENEAM